jgi:hypothetical protein
LEKERKKEIGGLEFLFVGSTSPFTKQTKKNNLNKTVRLNDEGCSVILAAE